MKKSYDLALVCGRRPELIARTLESFHQNVFPHFSFANVLVNIDPFCGDAADGVEVRDIVESYFPEAIFFEPESASFGAAVKRLWKNSKSDILLHLEDDWVAIEEINSKQIEQYLINNVTSLSLMAKEKNWTKKSLFHTSVKKIKIFGIPVWRKRVSIFSTSPCFLSGKFARKCAELMNPELDPEKQFYQGTNQPLQNYVQNFKNRFLQGEKSPSILEDIGRRWREKRSIRKVTSNGVSKWTS